MNILEDEKVSAFKAAFEQGIYSFNVKKYTNELKSIHTCRAIRSLNSNDIDKDSKILIDSIFQNQANRSRIIEIKFDASNIASSLNFKIEFLSNYISIKYKDELKSTYSTITERQNYIKELFSFTSNYVAELDNFKKLCDLIINDIDQASWAIKSIIDCLKISNEAKGIIV